MVPYSGGEAPLGPGPQCPAHARGRAEAAGGLKVISALQGPFGDLRFMPTGGITLETVKAYVTHPAIFAVGGSWMVPRSALDIGDVDTVERLTRETVAYLDSFA